MSESLVPGAVERRDSKTRVSRPPTFDIEGLRTSVEVARITAASLERLIKIKPVPESKAAEQLVDSEIEDLSALLEDWIEDPNVDQAIQRADATTLSKVEVACAQETKKLAAEADLLALKIKNTDLIARLEAIEDLGERSREIVEALRSPDTRTGASFAITTEEVAQRIWEQIERDFEDCHPAFNPWDKETYQSLLNMVQDAPLVQRKMQELLKGTYGALFEHKLANPEYVKRLAEFAERLEQETYMELPFLQEPPPLTQLITLYETFGSIERMKDLCTALDVNKHLPDWKHKPVDSRGIFNVSGVTFSKEKVTGIINIRLETENNDETTDVDRDITLNIDRNHDTGIEEKHLLVKHSSFMLPESLQGQGVAKKILRDSFGWYEQQKKEGVPVLDVRLRANVGVGGYAWAAYGFGWDKDTMVQRYKEEAKKQKKTLEPLDFIDEWARALTEHVNECERRANIFFAKVKNLTPEIRAAIAQEFADVRADTNNPKLQELVTPQRIAALGKRRYEFAEIKDEDGLIHWYLLPTSVKGTRLQEMHLGKAMSLGLNWYGKLPMEPKTDLEKSQRELLNTRLEL